MGASQKELTKNHLFANSIFSEDVEQMEKEKEFLNQRLDELIETEQQLLIKIGNALHVRKQENEEKKEKIKLLERKCEELEEFLLDNTIRY